MGSIILGGSGSDALTNLTLESETTSKLKWRLDHLPVDITQLRFGDTKVGGGIDGGKASIVIDKIIDGTVEFVDGKVMAPRQLQATIAKASVKNLAST